MIDRITIHIVWICFVAGVIYGVNTTYNEHLQAKGEAISHYLMKHHQINIPPSEAKYFDVDVTQWNVAIKDLDIIGLTTVERAK